MISDDLLFQDHLLSELITEVGALPLEAKAASKAVGESDSDSPVDLMIVNAGRLTDLRESLGESLPRGAGRETPVMGVTTLEYTYLSIDFLRSLGLIGLIDRRAAPEQVRTCLRQILYSGDERRTMPRAPCCIPVEVELKGIRTDAFTTSLSASGMGIATLTEIPVGDDVVVRWTFDASPEQNLEVAGTVVHSQRVDRPDADYEVGIVFAACSARTRALVSSQVCEILAALDCLDLGVVATASDARRPTDGIDA